MMIEIDPVELIVKLETHGGPDLLRDFASLVSTDDPLHFALMARADQLEGKLADDPGLRGVKP